MNRSLALAPWLFFLNSAIWVVLGFFSIYSVVSRTPEQVIAAWIIAVLMFGNAGAMLLSGILVGRRSRNGYYFALAVLAVNILLTFTDEFGALDLVTLLVDLVLLALLLLRGKDLSGQSSG